MFKHIIKILPVTAKVVHFQLSQSWRSFGASVGSPGGHTQMADPKEDIPRLQDRGPGSPHKRYSDVSLGSLVPLAELSQWS